MNTPRPTDAEQATTYARIAELLTLNAQSFQAVADNTTDDPQLGTFARAYANGLRARYTDLAAFSEEAAEQARSIAVDYAAHADGTYQPLRSA